MSNRYQIASRIAEKAGGKDLMKVNADSGFGRALRKLIAATKPCRIIETGTYLGTGTTRIIAEALRDNRQDDAEFVTIEINPRHALRATANIAERRLRAEIINGLSVPRIMLPTIQKIEQQFVSNVIAPDLVVDHEEMERATKYFSETHYPELPDDVLGKVLRRFNYKPDLVLLDSGGHMGLAEYQYVVNLLDGPCHVALDDVRHVKHFESLARLKNDSRFTIIEEGNEKFGYCIASFDPARGAVPISRKAM